MNRFKTRRPGAMIAVIVALAASFLSEHYTVPVMLMALLIGLASNFVYQTPEVAPGIDLCASSLLKVGVALLGVRVSFDALSDFGCLTLVLLALLLIVTFGFGMLVARLLGLESSLGKLGGGGVAICGASATVAIASVLPKSPVMDRMVSFTIISVTLLSTLAMVVYPMLAGWIGFTEHQTSFFLGAAIHDVAQVVGAGYSVSEPVGDEAVLIKLIRVAMLAPIVLMIFLNTLFIAAGSLLIAAWVID